MICTQEQVNGILAGDVKALVRPLYRKNGQAMKYAAGRVVPIQAGRYRPHVIHVRISSLETSIAGALRSLDEYDIPEGWSDDLPVAILALDTRFRFRTFKCCPR